ncbi:MAG TPA: hypothetical protein VG076_03635 [Acidimicrobiales bacterium]|jgi:hypothetical protein|nr:hypothetical protein [Acidimicrobiales bacterium]
MSGLQVEYTERELLQNHRMAEPLIAGGVRCHGGFDDHGTYVSPRTKNRWPAIQAWQQLRAEQFGTPLLDIALDTWPGAYPNVAQAKFLLREGVREPIIGRLTQIGTVEGFGSMIRYSPIPELQSCFVEDIRGTATWHLGRGLYEAHARDEAGYKAEGGHKQMWFAARDIAFESPLTEDQTQLMMDRMFGYGGPAGSGSSVEPLFPDVDESLELLIQSMARLLLIEISAYHVFAWAEEVLADADLVAGDGEASRLVSYIRADEAPHVEYLKTTLSEMRDRTFVAESGRHIAGHDVIGQIWERARAESIGARHEANVRIVRSEIEHCLDGNPRGKDILAEFHSLAA